MIQIIIVEDHPLVVDGLINSFAKFNDINIAAIAKTGAECRKILKKLFPILF